MLGTLMTALFFMVKALVQLGNSLFQEEPLPYLVHQPVPWQVQCVTPGRRASRDCGKGGCSRHNSVYGVTGRRGDSSPVSSSRTSSRNEEVSDPTERAAVTIQTHYRKYHQYKRRK